MSVRDPEDLDGRFNPAVSSVATKCSGEVALNVKPGRDLVPPTGPKSHPDSMTEKQPSLAFINAQSPFSRSSDLKTLRTGVIADVVKGLSTMTSIEPSKTCLELFDGIEQTCEQQSHRSLPSTMRRKTVMSWLALSKAPSVGMLTSWISKRDRR